MEVIVMDDSLLGKKAEAKIKEWLDRPQDGYCFDRIPDQMTGFYGSKNICDFTLYIYPNKYYIESKATWQDRFDFSMLTEKQHTGLTEKSKIYGVYGVVIVLFATYKRAIVIDIREINRLIQSGRKSINIKTMDKIGLQYHEIETIPSRKELLDYTGGFQL
ncbi:hypothetical protein RUMCAL_00320 [Ruminococcus callidus ATCC 27760]|uniref:Holliday junction resolvase RecU n=2 Tax=Ruminococcus callidus TaxID=40519 RepID=U2MD58_9FIRM|nr:hypothetical protein RUMCAL_00320 [Ruminococcus callidus ATCC 27760]